MFGDYLSEEESKMYNEVENLHQLQEVSSSVIPLLWLARGCQFSCDWLVIFSWLAMRLSCRHGPISFSWAVIG